MQAQNAFLRDGGWGDGTKSCFVGYWHGNKGWGGLVSHAFLGGDVMCHMGDCNKMG